MNGQICYFYLINLTFKFLPLTFYQDFFCIECTCLMFFEGSSLYRRCRQTSFQSSSRNYPLTLLLMQYVSIYGRFCKCFETKKIVTFEIIDLNNFFYIILVIFTHISVCRIPETLISIRPIISHIVYCYQFSVCTLQVCIVSSNKKI